MAEVGAGRQDDQIAAEAIPTEVAAFPDQFGPFGRQGGGNRSAADGATLIVRAVCAHQQAGGRRQGQRPVAIEGGDRVLQVGGPAAIGRSPVTGRLGPGRRVDDDPRALARLGGMAGARRSVRGDGPGWSVQGACSGSSLPDVGAG